jgi:hypothetical protein
VKSISWPPHLDLPLTAIENLISLGLNLAVIVGVATLVAARDADYR